MVDGFVECLEVGAGFAYVEGWLVLDSDQTESGRLAFFADGQLVGEAQLTDFFERPDLAGSDVVRRAFRSIIPIPAHDRSRPVLIAYERGGRRLDLPLLSPPRPFEGRGALELIEGWGIGGWAWHPARKKAALSLDGGAAFEIPLSILRSDLPPTYSVAGGSGFQLDYAELNEILRCAHPDLSICDGEERSIELLIGCQAIDRVRFRCRLDLIGKIERYENSVLSGWACVKAGDERGVALDVLLGGARYLTCEANFHRNDLIRKGMVTRGGGFKVTLPPRLAGSSEQRQISVRFALTGRPVPGATFEIPEGPRWERRTNFWDSLPAAPVAVSIIVPIYNAAASLERCLQSLVQHTSGNVRLILINDASPQPSVRPVLEAFRDLTNVVVVENETNLGFTKTVNRGIEMAGRDDVIFLNSDTEVTPCWLEHLVAAAYHRTDVGTVTPLSDNAGAFSVPEPGTQNRYLTSIGQDNAARIIAQGSQGLYPTVPTGNGFCLYVKRACIDRIGMLDAVDFPIGYGEENDFCQRAIRAGFTNIVDDRTLIFHERSASFLEQKTGHYAAGRLKLDEKYPEYSKQVRAFRDDRGLMVMRWRVRLALRSSQQPRLRIVYVIATETGGTPQTNRDLMTALDSHVEPYLLRCNSRDIFFSQFSRDGDVLLETYNLASELELTTHRSIEYNQIVADLMVKFAIELVHIRHIAWHSIDLTQVCARLNIPTVFSFHDYYTVCPNIKLLDETSTHCEGICTLTPGKCDAELWPKTSIPPLKHRFVHRWREMHLSALQSCAAFVTTSENAKQILQNAFPALGLDKRLQVIPHGRSFELMRQLATPLVATETLRILVPGNISDAKGASLIREAAALDEGRTVEFHILGDGGRLKAGPGLHLHGRYARGEIDDRIAAIRPHFGAVLSLWPETYCHTLSEMWSCGLPVLGMSIGAVGERIESSGAGWLISPKTTASELLRVLAEIAGSAEELSRKLERVRDWQSGTGSHYTTVEMGDAYLSLYESVFEQRCAFATPQG